MQNCGRYGKPGGEDGQADGLAAGEDGQADGLAAEEVASVLAVEEGAVVLAGVVFLGVDVGDADGVEEEELRELKNF